ncbi:MAG: cardiolipin synthase [Opitutaceae bacterium]|nr:cardiolipin synthase [Opitutaceae bacterium]
MKLAFLLSYLATWALIPHLLLLKKRPTATLAWLWAIIFIPFLGAFFYLLVGTDRLQRRRLRRRRNLVTGGGREGAPELAADPEALALVAALPERDRQFFRLISRVNQLPVGAASSLQVLRDAAEYYPALEARIRAARHHIHFEVYIWQPDATGERFLRLLTEAAQRGVIVRLLIDEVGSSAFAEDALADFRAAGGKFSWFQSLDPRRNRFFLNLRNHRKVQIVDGAVAFVGGMNIGREYEGHDPELGPWRDVQVEAQGPIVGELQAVFADDWFFAAGERISASHYYSAPHAPARYAAQVVLGGPDLRYGPIGKSLVSVFNEASKRLWIATGYFVPSEILLTAIALAASRGVDVRLLISERNDHPWLVRVGRSFYSELFSAGVRIYEYSAGLNHAKVTLADDDWGMIGSTNLDYRSLRLNFELNLLFHSREANARLADILERDFAEAQEIKPAEFAKRPFGKKFIEAALRPLSPIL